MTFYLQSEFDYLDSSLDTSYIQSTKPSIKCQQLANKVIQHIKYKVIKLVYELFNVSRSSKDILHLKGM